MKMEILDCNQIKKKQMKKRTGIVIKLRFLSIQNLQEKKIRKKSYIYFFLHVKKRLDEDEDFGLQSK